MKFKRLVFFIPILLGILFFVYLVVNKAKPKNIAAEEQTSLVKTFNVQKLTVIPKITGYGTAEPGKTWKAVSEVSGKVVWINNKLDDGSFFKEGDKLLEIDDSIYKLKVAQYNAEIKKIEANILELKAKEKNYQESLKLFEKILEFNLKEFNRNKILAKSKAVSTSQLEQAEISVLSQKTNIQELKNSLTLIPSQLQYQEAQLEATQSSLSEAKLDLEYTVIKTPFDCRISKVDVEISQYIQKGQELIIADSIKTMEISAQVDVGKLDVILGDLTKGNIELSKNSLPLKVIVKFQPNGKIYQWTASYERIETVDPNTRTVGIVAVVTNPYSRKNNSPALVKGMYCEVDIYGPPQQDCIVIPRASIHDGKVYKVTKNNRLKISDVDIEYSLAEFSVIKRGLSKGDTIVSSDILPAIDGMKLKTIQDKSLELKVTKEAEGDQ